MISTVCNLYVADGLYAIDSTKHSPLLGFAYDGFPIYGAYGYKNADGTGGIVRMKSSYTKRSITTRTQYADGTTVTAGPPVNTTYPIGYFREDYQYNATSAATPDHLDDHNGRFCVTPEYPGGIYAYFCTVDSNWNSAYPYAVGPTFYGVKNAVKVTSITEPVTTYTPPVSGITNNEKQLAGINIFPNPASDLIAIQLQDLTRENISLELYDMTGKCVEKTTLYQGSTITYFDTRTLYSGTYVVRISRGNDVVYKKIEIIK